jgi:hypothetical protein
MSKIFITLAILTVSTVSFAQQIQEKDVYTYASATMLEDLLDYKEITYEVISYNKYKMKLDEFNVFVTIDEGDVYLRTYFSNQPSLNRINDFNAQYRWTRIYLDKDGDLTIAQDISFTGGITMVNFNTTLNTYGQLIKEVVKHMQ